MTDIKLKPCPFCGSPAYSYHDNCIDFAGVKCDLGGCVCADILITENNWNTRPIEDALTARIAELEAAQKEALSLLPELEQGHYYCDDCWYSCPKAVDGCCDERQGDECNCGADNYNALLAKIIGLLTSEVQE